MQTPRIRVQRRPVHGVLLLDKPLGLSSNQALQKAKWLLRAEKAGHTGTLDPLATGVLPLCFGAATKFSQLQLDAAKTYEAVLQLGVTTTTGDAEGQVLERREVHVNEALIESVIQKFIGCIQQVPPMYSALKHDGKALYEYARAGQEVVREAREVQIFKLNWAIAGVDLTINAIKLVVNCSKGTYIRTLGEDIGKALGCGGHLTALRRIETGGLGVAGCVTLEQLEAMLEHERLGLLKPAEVLLAEAPSVRLDSDEAARFLSGLRRRVKQADAALVKVFGPGSAVLPQAFLGSAHIKAGELIPQRLLSPLEVTQILESASHE
jgi:tRNA pseudouridine55 synthase